MAVEVGEVSTGLGLDSPALGEASAGGVDFVGCLADGGLVAPWPAAAELVVERALAVRELLFGVASSQRSECGVPCARGRARSPRSGGSEASICGELAGEVSAADAQRFDAVGEGLVGADTGERDVGPVLVEPLPGAVDRTAAPTVLLLVAVVGGLFAGVAARLAPRRWRRARRRRSPRPGGCCNRSSSARRSARPCRVKGASTPISSRSRRTSSTAVSAVASAARAAASWRTAWSSSRCRSGG